MLREFLNKIFAAYPIEINEETRWGLVPEKGYRVNPVKERCDYLRQKHNIDLRTLTEREEAIFEIGCCYQAMAQQEENKRGRKD